MVVVTSWQLLFHREEKVINIVESGQKEVNFLQRRRSFAAEQWQNVPAGSRYSWSSLFEQYWCKMTNLPYIRFRVNWNEFKAAADKRRRAAMMHGGCQETREPSCETTAETREPGNLTRRVKCFPNTEYFTYPSGKEPKPWLVNEQPHRPNTSCDPQNSCLKPAEP